MWLKLKFWSKVTFLSILLVYALLFVVNNLGKSVTIWFWFGNAPETPLLLLVLLCFLAGALLVVMLRTVSSAVRQYRQIRQRERESAMESMIQKASLIKTSGGATGAPDKPTTT